MIEFIMATNNQGKVKELDRILNPLGVTVVTAKSKNISLDDVEENGATYAENAKIKAMAAFQKSGLPCIADDSGLSVDCLNGEPGVFSARYAGENATDEQRIAKLLKNMQNIPKAERSAHFVCSICCVIDEKNIIQVEGTCSGTIADSPKGNGGFGYDPVFLIDDGRTFGELSPQEKDKISHRGNALRMLSNELKRFFDNQEV